MLTRQVIVPNNEHLTPSTENPVQAVYIAAECQVWSLANWHACDHAVHHCCRVPKHKSRTLSFHGQHSRHASMICIWRISRRAVALSAVKGEKADLDSGNTLGTLQKVALKTKAGCLISHMTCHEQSVLLWHLEGGWAKLLQLSDLNLLLTLRIGDKAV